MTELWNISVMICYLLIVTTAYIVYGIPYSNSLPSRYSNGATIMTNESVSGKKDMVSLEDISTQPKTIHVGDNFKIKAMAANYSPFTIFFQRSVCLEKPLIVDFIGNNVKKLKTSSFCNAAPALGTLKPGEKLELQSPGNLGTIYKAAAAESTKAIAIFYYRINNNESFNITTSKTFSFTILTP